MLCLPLHERLLKNWSNYVIALLGAKVLNLQNKFCICARQVIVVRLQYLLFEINGGPEKGRLVVKQKMGI